jgi:hypothetical protein
MTMGTVGNADGGDVKGRRFELGAAHSIGNDE